MKEKTRKSLSKRFKITKKGKGLEKSNGPRSSFGQAIF